MTRAAARRFLLTLTELGYMVFDGRYFKLTPKVLELGYSYLASESYHGIVLPYLQHITDTVQESCSAGVLDNTDAVYIARAPSKRIITITTDIGTRIPAQVSSVGRVLLADLADEELDHFFTQTKLQKYTSKTISSEAKLRKELKKISQNGYSVIDEELEVGLRTISVPLRDQNGKANLGISIAASASRVTIDEMIENFLPTLLEVQEKAEATAKLAFIV